MLFATLSTAALAGTPIGSVFIRDTTVDNFKHLILYSVRILLACIVKLPHLNASFGSLGLPWTRRLPFPHSCTIQVRKTLARYCLEHIYFSTHCMELIKITIPL